MITEEKENEPIDDHLAWVNAVKKASEKVLRETADLPLPKIFAQIPDKPLNQIKNNYCKTYLKFSEEIDAQERERRYMGDSGKPLSLSRLSVEVEGNPRPEIYRTENSDRWKCSKCKDRGDRWYMLDHRCKEDFAENQ